MLPVDDEPDVGHVEPHADVLVQMMTFTGGSMRPVNRPSSVSRSLGVPSFEW